MYVGKIRQGNTSYFLERKGGFCDTKVAFLRGEHYEEDIYKKMAHSCTHKSIKDLRTDGDRHDRHFIGYAGC